MTRRVSSMSKQTGFTLFVSLVMLLLMTMIALSAMRLANTNLKVVSNEQLLKEAAAAATFALDMVANSATFASQNASSSSVSTGIAAYTVNLTKPYCRRYRTIPKSELVASGPGGIPTVTSGDMPCMTGSSSSPLTILDLSTPSAASGDSLCANTLWEVSSTATPEASAAQTGVSVALVEGIELRLTVADAQTSCK